MRVVLTRSAAELVRPALFEALSGERVGVELWGGWPAAEDAGLKARRVELDWDTAERVAQGGSGIPEAVSIAGSATPLSTEVAAVSGGSAGE